jgi:hypothetical protein
MEQNPQTKVITSERRSASPTAGVFDKKSNIVEPDPVPENKKDFKDPFQEHSEQISSRAAKQRPRINQNETAAEKAADALNNQDNTKLEAEFEDLQKISDKDLELAEQMVFRGYAEFDVSMPNLPNHNFTICSTSAEEISMVDEIIFDMVKSAENKEGVVDLPQTKVRSRRNALFLAIAYRGMDRQELMGDNSIAYLNTIKKSIIKISELEDAGEIEKAVEIKKSVKKYLSMRATAIRKLPTPTIDFLSGEKYNFDDKMLKIMSSKHILPKS